MSGWITFQSAKLARVDQFSVGVDSYHQRSIAETAMYRFKQLIGPTLSLRNYNAQVGEILAGVKVMNKLIGLGMPVRQPVN